LGTPTFTPIIVGVGQFTDRLEDAVFRALSPSDLAAEAARAALENCGAPDAMRAYIDAIAAVRSMADSLPNAFRTSAAPFGCSSNPPRSVATRIGCDPRLAVYSLACGDEPQKLVGEFAARIAAGECRAALLVGSEAIGTQRKLQAAGQQRDWNESVAGTLEDRGKGTDVLVTRQMGMHKQTLPPSVYPLFEHARRARMGLSRAAYNTQMAQLFARFNAVAADNPFSMSSERMTATLSAHATE
jgi:acetyl-CoA C-acetyltransferase